MPSSDSNPKRLRVAIVAQELTDDLRARAARWEASGHEITWITTGQTGPMVDGAARDGFATPDMWFSNEAFQLVKKFTQEGHTFDYIECADEGGVGLVLWNAAVLQGAFPNTTIAVRGAGGERGSGGAQVGQRAADEQHWFDLGMLCRRAMEKVVGGVVGVMGVMGVGGVGDIVIDEPPVEHARAALKASQHTEQQTRSQSTGQRFVFPGPVTTSMGCDLFVRAAKQLELQLSEMTTRDVVCEVWGEDSKTGPLGRSCWERCARYLGPQGSSGHGSAKQPAVSISRVESVCEAHSMVGTCAVFPGVLVDAVMLAMAIGAAGSIILRESTWNRAVVNQLAPLAAARIQWFGREGETGRNQQVVDELLRTMLEVLKSDGFKSKQSGETTVAQTVTHSSDDVHAIIKRAEQARLDRIRVTREPVHMTVAIPFYNLEAYLPRTLASVHRQSVKPREIVIVDDGSTSQQAHELLDSLSRGGTRVIRQPNAGLGAARNTALRHATTPWVLTLDADDLLEPTYVECMINALQRVGHKEDVAAIGSFMRCFRDDPSQDLEAEWTHPQWTQRWHPIGLDPELLAATNLGCTASCILHRERVLSCGGFDEYMVSFEDWELWCRLAKMGLKACIIPEYLLRYRQRSQSMYHATALPYEAELRMYILAKHPDLCKDWTLPLRVEIAMRHHVERGFKATGKPLRYIVADKVNSAAKAIGLGTVLRKIKGT